MTTVDEAFADVQLLFADQPECEAEVVRLRRLVDDMAVQIAHQQRILLLATRVCHALGLAYDEPSETGRQRVRRVWEVWRRDVDTQTR